MPAIVDHALLRSEWRNGAKIENSQTEAMNFWTVSFGGNGKVFHWTSATVLLEAGAALAGTPARRFCCPL